MLSSQHHLGYAVLTSPDGIKQCDTFTCGHCNYVVHIPKDRMPGGTCGVCWKLICDPCVDKGKCDPFEKKLERIESRDRFMRQVGLIG